MAGGSDPSIGGWLDHPMLVDFLFYFIFAAIARGPLAFATRWIWAADIAESIETAAVRDPSIGGWLDHPMLGDFLFYFIFLPLSLAVP
jgi:hypothetical protein